MSTISSPWLRSRPFDLTFVMGGAALTLSVPLLVASFPSALPVIFWIWVLAFEGSHFWATYSRTYLDREFRQNNPALLVGSLAFFGLPLLAVGAHYGLNSNWPIDLYGYFIFLWSLYHNVRQHFGFLSIYVKKSGVQPSLARGFRRVIYVAIVGAQIYFATHFKTATALPVAGFHAWPVAVQLLCTYGPLAATSLATLWLLSLAVRSFSQHGAHALVPALYTLVCLVFYSVMFYVVAHLEPFYTSPQNGAQQLMLLAVMNSLFHNIQYHAVVWHYSQQRYGAAQAFGLATKANGSSLRYATICLLMGSLFTAIVVGLHAWPSPVGTYTTDAGFPALAYVLFFGIIGHHFYLDQKIWRPSRQADLRGYMGLKSVSEATAQG